MPLGFPAIPADPLRLTCWLTTVSYRDRGYKPTIQTLRALFRRTKTFWRGRARPVLLAEIPIVGPDPAAFPPPRGSLAAPRGRRSGPSPETLRRRRDATVAHMAVLHDATRVSWATSHSTQRRSMS